MQGVTQRNIEEHLGFGDKWGKRGGHSDRMQGVTQRNLRSTWDLGTNGARGEDTVTDNEYGNAGNP